jgi:hypothetical protein
VSSTSLLVDDLDTTNPTEICKGNNLYTTVWQKVSGLELLRKLKRDKLYRLKLQGLREERFRRSTWIDSINDLILCVFHGERRTFCCFLRHKALDLAIEWKLWMDWSHGEEEEKERREGGTDGLMDV